MSSRAGDRGQATVEFALVLPVALLLLLGLVQVGATVAVQLQLENAARQGARAAAVAPARAAAEARAASARVAGGRDIEVRAELDGEYVTVTVSAAVPIVSSLPGLSDRRLSADVTMRREDLP